MYDDLLGDIDDIDDEPARKPYTGKPRGRPPGARNKEKTLHAPGGADDQLGDVMSGCALRWFQTVFGVERKTVAKAVEGLKPVRMVGATAYYSVREVVPYLVAPKMRIEEYLETISPDALPEQHRETYWNVQAKSQKVRVAAGDLWRTEDVIELVGEFFKHIKNTIMLWADTIEEQTTLSDEQRKLIVELSDELQAEIFAAVVERAAQSRTRNQLKELDPVIEREEPNYEDI